MFKDNENILKKPILYILIVLVIGFIYIFINLSDRNNIELPVYSESLDLGAKQSLVPNDFPLPQGVNFEQEFERSYVGTISYTALWQTSSESRDVIKTRYESYLKEKGFEVVYIDFGDGLGQLSGSLGNTKISMGFRELKDAFNSIQVEATFNSQ